MFKRQKISNSARRSHHGLAQRSRGLYYNSGRSLDRSEQSNRQSSLYKERVRPKNEPGKRWSKVPTVLVFILLIILAGWELKLDNNPRLVLLNNKTNNQKFVLLKPTLTYTKAAKQLFGSSISNSNKLTVNSVAIASKMEQEFPELDNVSITLPVIGNQPTVYIEPAIPALVLSEPSGSYIVSTAGKVLKPVEVGEVAGARLPLVGAQDNQIVKVGQAVLPSADITFIQLIIAQLTANHLTTNNFSLPAKSEELDVRIVGLPYFVKFNLNDSNDAKQQIGTFLATERYLAGKGLTPSQYIDVRVLGRAYYK